MSGGEYDLVDDRDRNKGLPVRREQPPEPKYDLPVGYFYSYGGRWQIVFFGRMPEDRIVQAYSRSGGCWKTFRLATQATATVRYKGDSFVHCYGFSEIFYKKR